MFSRFVLVEREAAVINTANSWPVGLQSVLHGFFWTMKPFVGSVDSFDKPHKDRLVLGSMCVLGSLDVEGYTGCTGGHMVEWMCLYTLTYSSTQVLLLHTAPTMD